MRTMALAPVLLAEWQEIRQLTYAYLATLTTEQLDLRLPFPESQPLLYQFWCMLGAQESFLKAVEHGRWQGFRSSLDDFDAITPALIEAQMRKSDAYLEQLVQSLDLQTHLVNNRPAYKIILRIIRHEMHHHGQLLNLLFCHRLPIPPAWRDEWALSYDNEEFSEE